MILAMRYRSRLREGLRREQYRAQAHQALSSVDQRPGRANGVRTIKDATVRAIRYASIDGLRRHVRDWLLAYNYTKRLKALRFKTPLEAIKQISAEKPQLFTRQPSHDMLGLKRISCDRFNALL